MRTRTKLLILAGIAPLLVYVLLILLTPACGTIIGYANQQLQLHISGNDTEKPLRLARLFFDARPPLRELYWPEPSAIEEKPDCWLVTFTAKTPIYSFLGFKQILRPPAPTMSISIDKADYRARFGN